MHAYGAYQAAGEWYVWVAECKYRKNEPMTAAEMERTLQAAAAVQEMRRYEHHTVWLVSTGGFTRQALAVRRRKGA